MRDFFIHHDPHEKGFSVFFINLILGQLLMSKLVLEFLRATSAIPTAKPSTVI